MGGKTTKGGESAENRIFGGPFSIIGCMGNLLLEEQGGWAQGEDGSRAHEK